jgi:hypothetical protein
MARPAAGAWAAGGACILLVAAAVLTPGGRPDAAARAALLATGRAEAAPEQLLLHGYERVAHTKKLLELRGRTLAQWIRPLTDSGCRPGGEGDGALAKRGAH